MVEINVVRSELELEVQVKIIHVEFRTHAQNTMAEAVLEGRGQTCYKVIIKQALAR